MLKWKKHKFDAIENTEEPLTDILAGMSGKNRVIKYFAADIDDNIYVRIYRDAEQIVDFPCHLMTTAAPIILCDIPLADGQLCKAGFYNLSAGSVTPTLVIGYEETG